MLIRFHRGDDEVRFTMSRNEYKALNRDMGAHLFDNQHGTAVGATAELWRAMPAWPRNDEFNEFGIKALQADIAPGWEVGKTYRHILKSDPDAQTYRVDHVWPDGYAAVSWESGGTEHHALIEPLSRESHVEA